MNARELIDLAAAEGKFFSVDFIKKDNSYRRMNARAGVHKGTKGGVSKHNPDLNFVVWDAQIGEHRTIPLDRVLKVNGVEVAA